MPGRGEFWKVAGTNKDGVEFAQLTESLQQQVTGGGATGHTIAEEGSNLPQQPILDFVGAGVVATDGSGKTIVTISGGGGGHVIEDEGTPLTQRADLNFVGAGVTAADVGGKTVVTIPAVAGNGHVIQDEGTPITQQANLNFVGAGVSAVAGGEDTTIVTIPSGTGHVIEDEGGSITQRPILNFIGAGVTASDDGEKTNVTIPGGAGGYATIQDEGTPLAQENTLDFVGAGVVASAGSGKTLVTIAGGLNGHVIADTGSALPQQPTLDFEGAGVTASNDGELTKTLVQIPSKVIEDEGSQLPNRSNLNFIGAGVSAADVGAKTVVTIPGILPLLSFVMAASDETTDLTTGDAKLTFRMPYAFTLTEVRASVTDAPTGAVITVNIRLGGVDILSTPLTIDAGELTSETAVTPPVILTSALTDDGEIKIDLDTIGSILAGKGLKVTLIGNPT